jgi:hypothetical protein
MSNVKCSYKELIPIHKLIEHPKNPHMHSPEQIERLAQLIDHQGIRHPIIVSKRSGFIVAGHGRLQALKKLMIANVPVDYQDFENEAQEYAFIVSDNAIGKDEWAALDVEAIKKEIEILPIEVKQLGLNEIILYNLNQISTVNKGHENEEWVGLPNFEKGDTEIKISLVFKDEEQRENWASCNNIKPERKMNNQWICYL